MLDAWGLDESLECPPESTKIEFQSPITQSKKILCGYEKDGSTVKHGFEHVYDKSGNISRKTYFVHGKESTEPSQVSAPIINDSEAVKAIKSMLKVLVLQHTAGAEEFKVQKCDNNPSSWVRAALTKTALPKSYKFSEGCDVAGSFTAKFGDEFPVKFDLRKLNNFNQTEMTVIMDLKRTSAIRYEFQVTKGKISSPNASAEFTANYGIDIDPITRKFLGQTQEGQLHIIKIDGKDFKITHPLIYE